MTRATARYLLTGLTAVAWLAAPLVPAGAETVELVTYYPTAANTGDLHVRSLTVGDGYRNVTPDDGEALVFDALGIGLPVGTPVPAGPLHVVGVNRAVSSAIFVPGTGAGSDIRVGIGTQNPRTRLDLRGALTLEDVNGAGVIYFRNTQVNPLVPVGLYIRSDDDPATFEAASERVFIGANGRVGIGTTVPRSTLDIRGQQMLEDVNGVGALYFRNTQVNPLVPPGLYIRSDNDPATFEPASERMFIGAAGNVGIGTTTPRAPAPNALGGNLDVNDIFLRAANAGAGAWLSPVVGGIKMLSGTYVGNGGTGRRTIAVPGISAARPIRMLFIFEPGDDAMVIIKTETMGAGGDLTYRNQSGAAFDANPAGPAIHFEATGFSLNRGNQNANRNGATFHFVVLTSD